VNWFIANNGGGEMFYGGMDDVRIYKPARTASQIGDLYNTPVPVVHPVLSIGPAGDRVNLLISWTPAVPGFSLYGSTNLNAGLSGWSFIPSSGTSVLVPATNRAQYFRLSNP
jgi:hypothetical protein